MSTLLWNCGIPLQDSLRSPFRSVPSRNSAKDQLNYTTNQTERLIL